MDEIAVENWKFTDLENLYQNGQWKSYLSTLFKQDATNLEEIKVQKLLELVIYGEATKSSNTAEWSSSSTSVIILKTILQTYSMHKFVQQIEIDNKFIAWLFQFISNPQEKMMIRATALSILTLLIKIKKMPAETVQIILNHMTDFFQTALITLLPEYLREENNPLILLTSQIQELLNTVLLKYEQNNEILSGIAQNLPTMVDFLLLGFPAVETAVNNPQDKFQIQLMTLFSITAECTKPSENPDFYHLKSVVTVDEEIKILIALLNRIIKSIDQSIIIHDIFQNCFHYLLYQIFFLSSIHSSSVTINVVEELNRMIYEILLTFLQNAKELFQITKQEDKNHILIQIKKFDIWINFIANFYEDKIYSFWKGNDDFSILQINHTILMIIDLHTEMKQFLKMIMTASSANKEEEDDEDEKTFSKEEIKEIKQSFSEIRKSTISCLEMMLQHNHQWILQNSQLFWKLSIQILSTPILFPIAYDAFIKSSTLENQQGEGIEEDGKMIVIDQEKESLKNEMIQKIMNYLLTALKQIENYSTLQVIEDILEVIKQFAEKGCIQLFQTTSTTTTTTLITTADKGKTNPENSNVLCELLNTLTKIPKKLSSQLTPMKWEMMILSTLYECSLGLHKNSSLINSKQFKISFQIKYFAFCISRLLNPPPSTSTKTNNNNNAKKSSSQSHIDVDDDEIIDYQHLLLNSLIELSDDFIAMKNYSLLKDYITDYYQLSSSSSTSPSTNMIPFHEVKLFLEKKLLPKNIISTQHPPIRHQQDDLINYEDETIQFYLCMDLYSRISLLISGLFHLSFYHYDTLFAIFLLSYANSMKEVKSSIYKDKIIHFFNRWRENRQNPQDNQFILQMVGIMENIKKSSGISSSLSSTLQNIVDENDTTHNLICLSSFLLNYPKQNISSTIFFGTTSDSNNLQQHSSYENFQILANEFQKIVIDDGITTVVATEKKNNPDRIIPVGKKVPSLITTSKMNKKLSADEMFEKMIETLVKELTQK